MNDSMLFPEYKSYLKDCFIQFIRYKKSTGRKERLYATVLKTFDSYCLTLPEDTLCLKRDTVNGFLRVSSKRKISSVYTYASVLRELAKYMIDIQNLEDVYIPAVKGSRKSCYVPYIFSEVEISCLLKNAACFPSPIYKKHPNMRNVFSCLYTMLYCTGMRVSEALSLKLEGVYLDQKIIFITEAKNDKQRLVPMSESLVSLCYSYLDIRISARNIFFFDSGSEHLQGKVVKDQAYRYFRKLLAFSGIEHRGRGFGPRLHDLRASFAVHSLRNLSRKNGDINAYLEYLSLYMGHQSIYETQDYLWLTDELASDMLGSTSPDTAFLSEEFNRKAVAQDV